MGFERSELPCGIRVVSERSPGQRSVSVGVWVGAGSRDEPAELAGATHFLEHLVFKGTPSRSALDIAQAFDAVGGDLNGFTTKELTCFHARVLEEDLPLAVESLADMVQNPLLAAEDLEAERGVVLEEIAMHEDVPDDVVFDLFHESLWADHPIGRRVQGYRETVAAMTGGALRDYFVSLYPARNVVVAAAGAVDHANLLHLVERSFPSVSDDRPPSRVTAGPPRAGVVVPWIRDIEQVHVTFGTAGVPRGDERRWAISVLNVALGGGMSSRLFQEIRERRGLAYSVSSGHQGFAETGIFTAYAACTRDNLTSVLGLMRDEIARVADDGITEEEVARAIGHLRGSLLLSMDDNGSMMTHLGKSELCLGEILSTEEMIERVESVDANDVKRVARDVLGTGGWSLGVLGPVAGVDLARYVEDAA